MSSYTPDWSRMSSYTPNWSSKRELVLRVKIVELKAEVAKAQEAGEKWRQSMYALESRVLELKAEVERLREIVMAVERKFSGETRVQTALRYVREAETRANEPGQACAALKGGGE